MHAGRLAAVPAAAVLVAGAGTAAQAPAAGSPPPVVEQMVVFPDGAARAGPVPARATSVRIGRRRCSVGAGTPLAALIASRVARLGLRDYGSCSSRERDAGGLFVHAVGPHRNRGQNGWVYKVGTRLGTAGAADPRGPFGRGRLRRGAELVWFYCVYGRREPSCQRTLGLSARVESDGSVTARVAAYDDEGRAAAAAGATVQVGPRTATTDAAGMARLTVSSGSHVAYAVQRGRVRSLPRRVVVP